MLESHFERPSLTLNVFSKMASPATLDIRTADGGMLLAGDRGITERVWFSYSRGDEIELTLSMLSRFTDTSNGSPFFTEAAEVRSKLFSIFNRVSDAINDDDDKDFLGEGTSISSSSNAKSASGDDESGDMAANFTPEDETCQSDIADQFPYPPLPETACSNAVFHSKPSTSLSATSNITLSEIDKGAGSSEVESPVSIKMDRLTISSS